MSITIPTQSTWVKALLSTGTVLGIAIDAKDLLEKSSLRHEFKDEKTIQSYGESLLAALMLASYCKKGERINLNIRGSGNVFQSVIDSHPDGSVRGYVVPRESSTPYSIGENAGPWGDGLLSVLRTKDTTNEPPYIGTVPLVTGHLAKDLTFYWLQSEQVPTAIGLSVKVSKAGKVTEAAGFMVQALPGASEEDLKWIEAQIHDWTKVKTPKETLAHLFQNAQFSIIETQKLSFKCDCSVERVERALALVGVAELKSLIEERNGAEVKCDFCSENYKMDAEKLEELIARSSRPHEP